MISNDVGDIIYEFELRIRFLSHGVQTVSLKGGSERRRLELCVSIYCSV